jgi:hypothetical protein
MQHVRLNKICLGNLIKIKFFSFQFNQAICLQLCLKSDTFRLCGCLGLDGRVGGWLVWMVAGGGGPTVVIVIPTSS